MTLTTPAGPAVSQPRSAHAPRLVAPILVAAVVALGVRLAVGLQGLARNPLLSSLQLDSWYYVKWAGQIASGDVAGADPHGFVTRGPFILNPLYAYVLAPMVRAFEDTGRAVVVFQALLGGGTAALAAAAAGRFFGRAAAWTAGLAVALSMALVHLDAHVAVSGLAAFLVAGAVFASAPAPDGGAGRGHGPAAAGLWLGLGALARPITMIALPFFAWKHWKDGGPRRGAVVVAVFFACALPSLMRNWIVGGEPDLYTCAAGLNIRCGNNPDSRKYRTMAPPPEFRFSPTDMHDDAKRFVMRQKGGDPSPAEVSSFFTRMAIEEFIRAPGESIAWYANKARWFFSPVETPSTASLATDLLLQPLLRLAFVPTWILAAAAAAGAFAHRRRRDVVCGPAALLFAHVAVLTLVFPLSHYRSPAVAAMAVLAGGAVQAAVVAWNEGARRRAAAVGAAMLAVAAAGACPPQPDPLTSNGYMLLAFEAREGKRYDESDEYVKQAMAAFREAWPNLPEILPPIEFFADTAAAQRRWEEAIARIKPVLEREPDNWRALVKRSRWRQNLGQFELALKDARAAVAAFAEIPDSHRRLGELLVAMGRDDEARDHLVYAVQCGLTCDPEALRRCNIVVKPRQK